MKSKITHAEGFKIMMNSPCAFTVRLLINNTSIKELKQIKEEWVKLSSDITFASQFGDAQKIMSKHKQLLKYLEKRCKKKNILIF